MRKILLPIAMVAMLACSDSKGDIIGFENFDGGAVNLSSTTNVFPYGGGGGSLGDVFGVVSSFAGGGTGGPFDVWDDTVSNNSNGGVNAGDMLGVAGQNTSAFFALNDADGPDGPGFAFATWSFNIASATALSSIQIDIGAMGDFEAGTSMDGFTIAAQIDGGGFFTIFNAVTDEAASREYRALDNGVVVTLNDPLALFIDGSATSAGFLDKSNAATGLFDTYTSTLFAGLSGSNLDIRISWAGTPSGGEPQGIDNITINGVVIPEPSAMVFGIIATLGLIGCRRR